MKKCTYWVSTLVSLILFLAPAFNAAHAKGSVPTSRGYTDYIDLGAPDALTFPNKGSFTVEAWVCVAFTRDKAMVYSKNSGRSSGNHTTLNYTFGLTQGGQSMGARYANIWREALLPKPVMPGNWHHLAYSFDNGKLTFVFDGIEMGTESFPFNYYSTHTIEIGGYASGYDFWGSMADVRVWNTARTALQIRGDMNRRLTGTEAGLVGYWPLDEGSGPTVFDRTVNSNNGTWAGSHEWVTADDLDLALFTLAHPVTGSTRFTCTNEVAIVALSIPPDCDQYQITLSDESINPSDWLSTNTAPGLVQFDRPTVDTNMTFTAWYTNSTASVALRREEASIFYTTVAPVSSVRVALTREQVLPNGVIIQGTDLDDGSTGGAVNGTNLAIVAWTALAVQPGDDSTVTEDFVT